MNWASDKSRKHFVFAEIMRTVKAILVQGDNKKFRVQTNALREMLTREFNRLDALSED